MAALPNPAMLALRVENPPVAIVAKAWFTASSGLIPRAISAPVSSAVNSA